MHAVGRDRQAAVAALAEGAAIAVAAVMKSGAKSDSVVAGLTEMP